MTKAVQRVRINSWVLHLLIAVLFLGCTSREQREFNKAELAAKEKKFSEAVSTYDNTILLNQDSSIAPEAAREGARIAQLELKDFKKAAHFLKFIVLYSKIESDRQDAQKQVAMLYFDHLADYKIAVEELNKTILLVKNEDERNEFKLKLAKAYYFSSNFPQSESEANSVLAHTQEPGLIFQALMLKGNIYLAQKDLPRAALVFNNLLEKFPEKAVKENAAMSLAVAYEEMKDYKSAVSVLEKMKKYHSMPEYIDLRIKRLTLNQKNQPGAKGLRRK